MSRPFVCGYANFISMGRCQGACGFLYQRVQPIGYSKSGQKFITMAASYNKGADHVGPTYDKVDSNIAPTNTSFILRG